MTRLSEDREQGASPLHLTPELACVGDIGCALPAGSADSDEPTARQPPPTQARCRVKTHEPPEE
jgi:hypothetical protein